MNDDYQKYLKYKGKYRNSKKNMIGGNDKKSVAEWLYGLYWLPDKIYTTNHPLYERIGNEEKITKEEFDKVYPEKLTIETVYSNFLDPGLILKYITIIKQINDNEEKKKDYIIIFLVEYIGKALNEAEYFNNKWGKTIGRDYVSPMTKLFMEIGQIITPINPSLLVLKEHKTKFLKLLPGLLELDKNRLDKEQKEKFDNAKKQIEEANKILAVLTQNIVQMINNYEVIWPTRVKTTNP
jgi:hypothetical protein